PVIYAAGDVAECDGGLQGLWPVAVAQAEVAAANAVGVERLYDPQPPATILKGTGLSVMSIGDVHGIEGDELLSHDVGDDEVRYWRLVIRDGTLVGAVVIGDWPQGPALIDAVATGGRVEDFGAVVG